MERASIEQCGTQPFAKDGRSATALGCANRDMPKADFAKWVRPEQLADVIVFLLSDRASAITGALIPVTGRV